LEASQNSLWIGVTIATGGDLPAAARPAPRDPRHHGADTQRTDSTTRGQAQQHSRVTSTAGRPSYCDNSTAESLRLHVGRVTVTMA